MEKTTNNPTTGDGRKTWVAGIDAVVVGGRRSTSMGLLLEIDAMCVGKGENRGEVVTARYAAKEINVRGRGGLLARERGREREREWCGGWL
ncbi:unnamed protein product [Prunus armeniaca]|uniref:Uncharacterized protein n=1 Tax=Prunus armeniaca TaxID=36596 RepID=A0A6J5V8M6_PRUAR|nr:unnamed protein product [Prunus armeniaca]